LQVSTAGVGGFNLSAASQHLELPPYRSLLHL